MTEEDFIRWREDRVTQWVFKACRAMSDAQLQAWYEISWTNGKANENALIELRTRADAYRALYETEYAAWCQANGDEQRQD